MANWDSEQYIKFERQRTQPSIDLISRIRELKPKNILDIGCGPGNSTYQLHKAFRTAKVTAVDNSENMLNKARRTYKDIEFIKCDVSNELDMIDGSFDLIFSNACIHWIPGQENLIKNIAAKLSDNGVLAVQIPLIQEAPFYKMLSELVLAPKWREKLSRVKNFYNLLPEEYYDVLSQLSSEFDIWQTTYYHIVDSFDGVIDWYKGSGLRPYLDALGEMEQAEFQNDILRQIPAFYHEQKDGRVILKMPRLFFKMKNT